MPTTAFDTSTNVELVPAVAGARIVVLGFCVTGSADGTVTLRSGSGGANLTHVDTPGGAAWHFRDSEMSTAVGASLNLITSVEAKGHVQWRTQR